MEEALPITVSNETQKAPEEVFVFYKMDCRYTVVTRRYLREKVRRIRRNASVREEYNSKEEVMNRQRRLSGMQRRCSKNENCLKEPVMMKRRNVSLRIEKLKNHLRYMR
jgi:hypothetical protein